jgi:dipeptidyl aminopeptidase/acylaminoacyl peptidase
LSATAGSQYTDITLPFSTFEYVDGRRAIEADVDDSRFRCTLTAYDCTRIGDAQGGGFGRGGRGGGRGGRGGPGGATEQPAAVVSPDGRLEAFIQNHNVAIRPADSDQPTGRGGGRGAGSTLDHTLLSNDGSEGDAYQLRSIEWSPDSRRLVAYRRRPGYDRQIHYVRSSPTGQLQPVPEVRTYRKPGDVLDFNQPVLFDVESRQRIAIDTTLFPDPYRISRPAWKDDGRAYTFEYNQRGHQVYRVLEVDGATGAVRTIIHEESPTFISYRASTAGLRDTGHIWRHDIDDGREILWMSERDGWSHIYLYDGDTGEVKNRVTSGEWVVKYVDRVDEANRHIYFSALGMNEDQDPYFVHYYRINFDGTGLVAYTEANGSHSLDWSPDRQYYVDTYSRVDMPPVVELHRASDGRVVMDLERADMTAQLATGWQPPEVFVAKGRDGVTDIWGIIVRPVSFDPNRTYPVLEQIYAGPQGSFVPKTWGGGQNLLPTAELGFILVQIDGMGTNNRSKAFHDVAWRNLGDAGFPDRIRWHRAAAAEYPWYDATHVGLYGGSAGGQNAAGGVLFHGDFYSAAFASSGCHDNRMDKIWWNEQWMGWPLGPHYEASSNVVNAHRLTGKLFLAVGEMDTNVDPASTMQLVDALVRAGKSFELLVVPNGGHGALGRNGARKRNDFFVKALMGVDPPDWNAIEANGNGGVSWPDPEEPPPSFFESPDDDSPPYTWW